MSQLDIRRPARRERTAQATTGVTITIPGTIHRQITPNASRQYPEAAKHRLRRELKGYAIRACEEAGLHLGHDLEPPIQLHYVIAWEPRRKIMDRDNCISALKWAQDGIAQVLRIDDRHFIEPTVTQTRDDAKRGYIKVHIEHAESEAA